MVAVLVGRQRCEFDWWVGCELVVAAMGVVATVDEDAVVADDVVSCCYVVVDVVVDVVVG
jgi:hypothetical protein